MDNWKQICLNRRISVWWLYNKGATTKSWCGSTNLYLCQPSMIQTLLSSSFAPSGRSCVLLSPSSYSYEYTSGGDMVSQVNSVKWFCPKEKCDLLHKYFRYLHNTTVFTIFAKFKHKKSNLSNTMITHVIYIWLRYLFFSWCTLPCSLSQLKNR